MPGDFAGIYMSLPECIEDVHNMRARSRGAYAPLTLHKKQAQVQNSQQNEFKRSRQGLGASRGSRAVQEVPGTGGRGENGKEGGSSGVSMLARCRGT